MTGMDKKGTPTPRVIAATALIFAALCAPALLVSFAAAAGDDKGETAFRLYFAIPFIATAERKPTRLGLQLLSEMDDETAGRPLPSGPKMQTAIDLGFTRDGLAKFDVIGADMRGAYEAFARAIGLTPEEIELCRTTDCLDWVKSESTVVPAAELSRD